MSLFKNVSQVLNALGSKDVRFTAITLPEQFDLWFHARNRLADKNEELRGVLDPDEHCIGMLTTIEGENKGFMVILPNSRYFTTEG